MPARLALAVLALQCCEICVAIKVPVVWEGENSEVITNDDEQFSVDQFKPQEQKPIPVEYFEYTAKKPQFAVDIASFHGAHSPENYYKARPVRPFTGLPTPELGKHQIQNGNRPVFHNFQEYMNQNEPNSEVEPISTGNYKFHPYKAEEPGFQKLYKDSTLDKVRNDIRNSAQRLQKYENEAGKPDIKKEEYLESPDETDHKKTPQRNIPAPYEIHRTQHRPIYYQHTPYHSHRDHILNQRFKHPWNQNYIKIRPVHYGPLKNHLQRLRQHHALRYGDERNEYPQAHLPEHYEEPSDGYDIYEKGKAKFTNLRNNLDESVNNLVRQNRPLVSQKLELQSDEKPEDNEDDEFIPIKNYAQVRRTETTKHLPRDAALDEAESFEEIKNAPRLREAVKSTRAQTVYTEEGYEDSAYDHAGERKHASDHEGHGGFLREKELSAGKYKTPSVSASYDDGSGSAYKNQVIDGVKWKENNKDHEKEEESEDFSENEHEHDEDFENADNGPINNDKQRNKRQHVSESKDSVINEGDTENDYDLESPDNEDDENNDETSDENYSNGNETTIDQNVTSQHDVNKREVTPNVPDIKFNTYLNDKNILDIAKEKIIKKEDLNKKYPYYFKSLETLNKNSPLRYAENLNLMPKKSKGGTEFYDSRSQFECPEVDEKIDPIPEKLKKNGHPDEGDDDDEVKNEKDKTHEEKPRLQGLGDKIDCFKAKYFGENPLDSPFFKEELIVNPEPPIIPNIPTFKLKNSKTVPLLQSASDNIEVLSKTSLNETEDNLHTLLEKLNNKKSSLIESLSSEHQKILDKFKTKSVLPLNSSLFEESNGYTNILENLKSKLTIPSSNINHTKESKILEFKTVSQSPISENTTYGYFLNKEDVTKAPSQSRKRRSTPFIYEPYKIIRDVQASDSKKTTTTGNVSPLIKQLQSSKVIDAVVKSSNEKEQPVKRNVRSRTYKDIGKKDREILSSSEQNDSSDSKFVDVSVDKRRGEPRYELRPSNHKTKYTPVENKKAMSVKDYESLALKSGKGVSSEMKRPSARSLFNIANNFHKSEELQNLATASSTRKTVTTSPSPKEEKKKEVLKNDNESEEDYDEEYEEDESEEEEEEESRSTPPTMTTTTTTTTQKPIFRIRVRSTTTTENPKEETTKESPKLRLVTRFNKTPPSRGNAKHNQQTTEKPSKSYDESNEDSLPKYREKKKKSSKSTIVTDSKRYGDDDDDMRKEEIDALIGVKQDMNDYMPRYEKESKKITNMQNDDSSEEVEDSDESYEDDEDEDEDDDDEEVDDNEDEEIKPESKQDISTTISPKRSLIKTTDAPPSTTEARSANLEVKPVVSRKKYEIHKETPVNKSSPHVTQFKQDIKEVEIVREIPRKKFERKPNKNIEVLDLYKDDDLASDINKLGAVEVFKENLDIKNSPKHGGNYRYDSASNKNSDRAPLTSAKPKDAETSQSENQKLVEFNDEGEEDRKMHGGNLKSINETDISRGDRRNAKLIELSDVKEDGSSPLHGGNFKLINDRNRKHGGRRSEKLIELNDDSDEDDDNDSSSRMHGGNLSSRRNSGRNLHGGNYRSSKLTLADNDEDKKELENAKGDTSKDVRSNSADLLNSFAQAVPILTTTPPYILDPSKRMYYYVD